MDKSYLLHNLKIVDNAEEDHKMLDLEFQNIHYDGSDLIADVIETARYVGEVNPGIFTTKHENVNLTGGGGSHTGEVTITLKNNTESDTLTVYLVESMEQEAPKWTVSLAPGATETQTANKGEFIMVQHPINNTVYRGVEVAQSNPAIYRLVSDVASITFNQGGK